MIAKLLRDHFSAALAFLAVMFLATIISFYSWGIGYMVTIVDKVNDGPTAAAATPQFNLDAAAKLDYRGIVPGVPTAPTPAATVSTSTAAAATTTASTTGQ